MTYANYCPDPMIERGEVPAFSPASPFLMGTAEERMPDKEFKNNVINSQIIPLWTVVTRTKKYELAKPLKVHIYSEDGLFFAENDTLIITGTGDSIEGVMNDFCGHVSYFYHYYKKLSWEEVIGDAARLKKLYETLFSEQE